MANPLRRINLYAGPGCGKSTLAAAVFARLKIANYQLELCQEYVKYWAYEKKNIEGFDQIYIFAKQQRLEERLLRAGIDFLVTDSPLLMQCAYAKHYGADGWEELVSLGKKFDVIYPCHNFMLRRTHGTYQQHGRYQDLNGAVEMDRNIAAFLDSNGVPFERIDNDADEIYSRVESLLSPRKS